MKLRNLFFVGALCLLFAAPTLLFVASRGGVVLPSWLTAEDAMYLSGGVTEADVRGTASLEGFAKGEFQQAVEAKVGNYIPAKAAALLGHAAFQRSFIDTSNRIFCYDCVPTYFGSSVVDIPMAGRLMEKTRKAATRLIRATTDAADTFGAFADRHSDQRVFIYLASDSLTVEDSPVALQTTQAMTYGDYRAIFEERGASYIWIDGDISFAEFDEGWFRTDHHWNIKGAFHGYETIARSLGFGESLLDASDVIAHESPLFQGTFARRGLDTAYSDQVLDYEMALPPFKVKVGEKEEALDILARSNAYKRGEWDDNAFASRYGEYFHGDYGLMTIENPSASSEDDLLIVADSYSNCMERFLAVHYRTTYVLDPRHMEESIDAFLTDHPDVKDVLVLMTSGDLTAEVTRKAFVVDEVS